MRKEELFELLGEIEDCFIKEEYKKEEKSKNEKERGIEGETERKNGKGDEKESEREEDRKRKETGTRKRKEVGTGTRKETGAGTRKSWKVWGGIAAGFLLICSAGLFWCLNMDKDIVEEPNYQQDSNQNQCSTDIAPMVYVNDTLYMLSGDRQSYPEWKEEFVYLGKIESAVSSDTQPTENFQANDPIVGCEVYQYGEELVVKIQDVYWPYIRYGESETNWEDRSEQEKKEIDPTYMGEE